MEYYRHKDDCNIDRDHPEYPASAVLMDCDGEIVCRFDEDWTNDQIWMALAFANRAYDIGFHIGGNVKASEIRRVIGL